LHDKANHFSYFLALPTDGSVSNDNRLKIVVSPITAMSRPRHPLGAWESRQQAT
jgi:hypothetical protein